MRWLFFPSTVTSTTLTQFLSTLDYAYHAAPFVYSAPSTSVSLPTLDYAYQGAAFCGYAKLPVTVTSVLSGLVSLDYAYQGGPFAAGTPSTSMDLNTMDYCYHGGPFVIYKRPT